MKPATGPPRELFRWGKQEFDMTTGARSRYRELAPPRSLADRFICLWTQRIASSGGIYSHSILPDGCVDVVWIGEAAPVVAGPFPQRLVIDLPPGAHLIGARFRPGWAAASLGLAVDELINQHVPLSEIWGARSTGLAAHERGHLSLPERLHTVVTALQSRFADVPRADPAIQQAVAWLARHPTGRVHELADTIGFSARQLQRRFRAAVGSGPKTFHRIMRLQRLLAFVPFLEAAPQNFAHMAASAGYADQAHMCREIRMLTDQTPRSLVANAASTLAMSDLFNTSGSHVA